MTNNLRIWEQVSKTDPKHTKKVEYKKKDGKKGRSFTTVDAYHQIEQATRIWGPMGIGWGYNVTLEYFPDAIHAEFALWYMDGDKKSEPIIIHNSIDSKFFGKPDHDAAKKLTTDSLTKSLSYLGFNSDVYMGRYDDNKYVQEMKKKHNPPADPPPISPKQKVWDVAKTIHKDMPDDEIGAIVGGLASTMGFDSKNLSVEQAEKMIDELLKDGNK